MGSAQCCPSTTCIALPRAVVATVCMRQEQSWFIMRKVFFFVGVIQGPQGHDLPWVFTPVTAEQNIPFIPRAAGVQPLHNLRGDAGPLPALGSRAAHRHVLCHTDCPHRACRSGSRVAPGILNSELLQSNLFWLELRLQSLGWTLCSWDPHKFQSNILVCQWNL